MGFLDDVFKGSIIFYITYIKNCLQADHISSRQFSFINYYIQQQQYFYLEKTENLNENSKSLQ